MDNKITLEIKNLDVSILNQDNQQKPLLKDVNFSIHAGETVALVGGSGSGKSITALAIMQLLERNFYYGKDSHIFFNGQDVLTLSEVELRRLRGREMSMIFQEPMTSLNPVLSIGYQISEMLNNSIGKNKFNHRIKPEKIHQSIRKKGIALLDAVGIVDPARRFDDYPHQLSGGMKQRVMIAMMLALEPKLLIADEPTTALDVTIQAQVIDLIRSLQEKMSISILFITHDLALVSQIADTIIVMHDTEIVESAPATVFFKKPTHAYSQQLLSISKPVIRNEKVDKKIVRDENPLIKINDLAVHYPIRSGFFKRVIGEIKAVNGVNITLYAGETLAIVGESGSGKTTLARAIVQLEKTTAGSIYFNESKLTGLSQKNFRSFRRHIQMIFQDPYASLNPHMRVAEIIGEGLQVQQLMSAREINSRVIELLLQVGLLPEMAYRFPHEFSGGQRQRIAIARALAQDPLCLICDEPTSALDVFVQAKILELLKKLQQEKNLAYLFITHNLNVVASVADRVAVMHLGEIVEVGTVEKVLSHPEHPYTQALLKAVPRIPIPSPATTA